MRSFQEFKWLSTIGLLPQRKVKTQRGGINDGNKDLQMRFLRS